MDDYYELLSVDREVDDAGLKRAYRKAAMQWHPDKNPGDDDAEARFKAVSEAYEVLSDPHKRQIYDRYGHDGLKNQGFGGFGGVEDIFSHFGDFFSDLFGGFGGGGRRPRNQGKSLRLDLGVTLEECLTGVERTVDIPRTMVCDPCEGSGAKPGTKPEPCETCGGHGQVVMARGIISMQTTCPRCRGAGQTIKEACGACDGAGRRRTESKVKVKVPPGVDTGIKLRLAGQGEGPPRPGGAPGDLLVVIHVAEHAQFDRHGPDLLGELSLDIVQATLGAEVEVSTLDGEVPVDVEPGTQPGAVLRLRGRGLPFLDGRSGRGDLHLRVQVQVPTSVSEEQAALLRAFAAADA